MVKSKIDSKYINLNEQIKSLNDKEKVFLTWLNCVRTLPFLDAKSYFQYLEKQNNGETNLRQENLFTIFRAVDMIAKYAHSDSLEIDYEATQIADDIYMGLCKIVKNIDIIYKRDYNKIVYISRLTVDTIILAFYCIRFMNNSPNSNNAINQSVCGSTYITCTAAKNMDIDFIPIILSDCDVLQSKNINNSFVNDTNIYGSIWTNFISTLNENGHVFWSELYSDYFKKGFRLSDADKTLINFRLNTL